MDTRFHIRAIKDRLDKFFNPSKYSSRVGLYRYQAEMHRRSNLPFQDIEELSVPISQEDISGLIYDFREPVYYGAFSVLKQYASLESFMLPPLKLGLQHGYVFEMHTWEQSKLDLRNLVWSEKVVKMYQEHTSNKNIFAIGAPFFYAESLLSAEEIKEEKKKLGKNLLAFPMHSSVCCDTDFDPNKFLSILEEEKKHFESVRVCMYWKDILRGAHKVYLEHGFDCVCNGHINDINFLRRQKALFEIADATISNGIGSHVGYSVFMNKPHKLIDDTYEYRGGDGAQLTDMMTKSNFKKVENAFLESQEYVITKNQLDVVDEFWGISSFKSKEELRKLLLDLYS